jgi:cytochrome c-type biogenesis protein CcmH/NrfF
LLGNQKKFKASLLVVIAAALCVGQSASEFESPEVNHIAGKLNCDCGCKLRMDCIMPPTGVCPVCRENKIRMANMLKSGMTEKEILDQYVAERGQDVLVNPPGFMGFAGPYIALFLGLGMVFLAIKHYRRLRPAPVTAPADDAELARYRDQIEKDLEKLD